MNKAVLLTVSIIIIIIMWSYYCLKNKESFTNYNLENAMGDVPSAQNTVLLQDEYPITRRNGISNNDANDIWWWYPTFEVGSYAQLTNNIEYTRRVSNGTCMPASMCGALYRAKKNKSNLVYPLPPVNDDCGVRVGYFTTNVDDKVLPFTPKIINY